MGPDNCMIRIMTILLTPDFFIIRIRVILRAPDFWMVRIRAILRAPDFWMIQIGISESDIQKGIHLVPLYTLLHPIALVDYAVPLENSNSTSTVHRFHGFANMENTFLLLERFSRWRSI